MNKKQITSPVKQVLIIAYLFPPTGGGGVQRTLKFVKYLPHFNWLPIVLTVREPFDYYFDPSLEKDIPSNVTVYRTLSIEPMKWIRKLLKQLSTFRGNHPAQQKSSFSPRSLKPRWLVWIKTMLFIPDNEIFWLPFAVFKGYQILRREKVEVIFSTASPFTDHLIALILSSLTGIPWVADFRDFWVDRANFPNSKWRRFIDRKLEKWVLTKASHVITTTSLIANRLKEIYPHQHYSVITNGFDEEDFQMVNTHPPEGVFRITYTGIFNKEQNPAKIFQAFQNFINKTGATPEKIRLRLVGQLDNPGEFENLNFLKQLMIDDYVEIIPYLPHEEVLKEMSSATVLLLLIGEYPYNEGVMTGKIFEYLRAKRPILAVIPPKGVAAEVIRETNAGMVVDTSCINEITKGLLTLYELYLQGNLENQFNRIHIERYERKNLTAELSKIFEQLSENA